MVHNTFILHPAWWLVCCLNGLTTLCICCLGSFLWLVSNFENNTWHGAHRDSCIITESRCAFADNDYIYWIDSGHSINRINRDLTQRKTIVSGLISAKELTIDPQGGETFHKNHTPAQNKNKNKLLSLSLRTDDSGTHIAHWYNLRIRVRIFNINNVIRPVFLYNIDLLSQTICIGSIHLLELLKSVVQMEPTEWSWNIQKINCIH